jgi:DNA repair photolyase
LSHPYVVDLIRVLEPHAPNGLARQSVLRALEKNRADAGLRIPPKFEQAVQRVYNWYSIDSTVFAKRKVTESEGLFYSPAGKGSGIWAINRDRAAAWLKAKLENQ